MLSIKYTKLAIQDLSDSYDYIYSRNPYAARSIIEKIEMAISKIAEHPNLGHNGRVRETYELVIPDTPFIVVYMIDSLCIKIVSILHTSRRYP